MPMGAIRLIPGVDTEKTYVLNEAGISTSSLIRFREGLVELLGGWERFYPFSVSGFVRSLFAWQDFNETGRLAVGTTTELNVVTQGGDLSDITPQILTSDFAPNFSTTAGSANVVVTDPNINNVTIFDSVYFNTPIAIGGLVLSGLYPIDLVLGPTSYRIVAGSPATSTSTTAAVPQFDTTNGSSTVLVTIAAHGLAAGGAVNFPIATTVGGVIILGTYTVVEVTSANQFSIRASNQASSTTSVSMNSGDAQILYYISLGPPEPGTGYGIGSYGTGGYGTGSTNSAQTGTPITATDWTFDNWGQTLLACPRNGGIYYWEPSGGFENAQLISSGPTFVGGIFVAMPAQILVAWGASKTQNIGIDQDPLLVRWSDQLDFTTWTASTTNQAGSFRIPNGSRIVGGMQAPQNALIWTDLDVWAMQYVGFPLVFGFNKVGTSCGLISAHAMTQLGSAVYWMGRSNFFVMTGGGAVPMPCTVWDAVFQDLDENSIDKCWAWSNTPFNEVWWFYPSASGGTGQCDKYVKYNVVEQAWDYGTLDRTAGVDQSVLGMPIAASATSIIYQHETGYAADGAALNASIRTGYFAISEGQEVMFVDWFIPDMRWGTFNGDQNATVTITFYSVMYPGDTNERSYGPYPLTSTTKFINPRIRGRFCAIEIASSSVGTWWRIGKPIYRGAPDGRL